MANDFQSFEQMMQQELQPDMWSMIDWTTLEMDPQEDQCKFHGSIYWRNDCSTCSSPLDLSEYSLYVKNAEIPCSRSKASNHFPLECAIECGVKFRSLKELKRHCAETRHQAFRCPVPGCALELTGDDSHFHQGEYTCAQCGNSYKNQTELDFHGMGYSHSAYACRYPDCGSVTSKLQDLIRHQACHKKDAPRHPCPHCRTYRGVNGFKRKDHLRQHISGYHKIENQYVGSIDSSPFCCRLSSCSRMAAKQNLRSLDDLTQHMLSQHNALAYTCAKPGCDRVGMNGFETKKLFDTHIKKEHPSPWQCTHPGCDRVGSKGWLRQRDMVKHMLKLHGISQDSTSAVNQ